MSLQAQTPSHESLQGLDYVELSADTAPTLHNERMRQVVVGFEQELPAGLNLRIEAYHRRFDRLLVQRLETDAERALRLSAYALPADLPPDDVILEHRPTVEPVSDGRGTARGIEVLLQRTGPSFSGWLGYAFSRATRTAYGHRVTADFDRPHSLTASASVALSRRVRLSAVGVAASGFPITPLHDEAVFLEPTDDSADSRFRPARKQDGTLLLGPNARMRRLALRNADRLRSYQRVDVRVTYSTLGHWEVYGELINVLGRTNYSQTIETPSTPAHALNVYEKFDTLPAFGLRFWF